MDKIKAVIYVRVSTDRQEYTRQINELLGYAKMHNKEKENMLNQPKQQLLQLIPLMIKLIMILVVIKRIQEPII